MKEEFVRNIEALNAAPIRSAFYDVARRNTLHFARWLIRAPEPSSA
jgi:hypothetical protein